MRWWIFSTSYKEKITPAPFIALNPIFQRNYVILWDEGSNLYNIIKRYCTCIISYHLYHTIWHCIKIEHWYTGEFYEGNYLLYWETGKYYHDMHHCNFVWYFCGDIVKAPFICDVCRVELFKVRWKQTKTYLYQAEVL